MNTELSLQQRSQNRCELCSADTALSTYLVPPRITETPENSILICSNCKEHLESPEQVDIKHWRCLNDSVWNPNPAVQVVAYRVLKHLSVSNPEENWVSDLLDTVYLEEDVKEWAEDGFELNDNTHTTPTLDSNGSVLESGDSVTIIKDLVVKGAGFTAKRGTAVRNISLTDNPEHIEGRVNGTRVVLLSCYLKKSK